MTGPLRRARFGRSFKPFRRPWLWVGLWCAAIAGVVVLSLGPTPAMQVPSGTDKIEHFLAYCALAAGAVQVFARRLGLLSACVALVLMGIALEYAQGALTAHRVMDARDALANAIGVLAGLATQFTPLRDALLHWDSPNRD